MTVLNINETPYRASIYNHTLWMVLKAHAISYANLTHHALFKLISRNFQTELDIIKSKKDSGMMVLKRVICSCKGCVT